VRYGAQSLARKARAKHMLQVGAYTTSTLK
jgi:cell division protein FtsN